jgi:hypothetical protein
MTGPAPRAFLALTLLSLAACRSPLDRAQLRGELDTCASAASEALLLAEQGERRTLIASFYEEHREALARQIDNSVRRLDQGAEPPDGERARLATGLAHHVRADVAALRPDDRAARLRLAQAMDAFHRLSLAVGAGR